MEQKDYLLREIEKMGAVLRAILNRLTGSKGNLTITIENVFEKTNEELIREVDFDLIRFLAMNKQYSEEYLSHFEGMNTVNLESLAEIICQIAMYQSTDKKRTLLEKALLLYDFCENTDKTFSFDRERQVEAIKKAI